MESWIFSMITPVFSITWSFRNHSNLLLKKHLLLCVENSCAVPCFCGNRDIQYFIFQDSLMNRKFKRTALIWIEIFCEVIIVFHVIFDQFNASLMKKVLISVNILLTQNSWTVEYATFDCVAHRGDILVDVTSGQVTSDPYYGVSYVSQSWQRVKHLEFTCSTVWMQPLLVDCTSCLVATSSHPTHWVY